VTALTVRSEAQRSLEDQLVEQSAVAAPAFDCEPVQWVRSGSFDPGGCHCYRCSTETWQWARHENCCVHGAHSARRVVVELAALFELVELHLHSRVKAWLAEIVARKVARLQEHALCEKLVYACCPAPGGHETCQQEVDYVFLELEDLKLVRFLHSLVKKVVVHSGLQAPAFFRADPLYHFLERACDRLHVSAMVAARIALDPALDHGSTY